MDRYIMQALAAERVKDRQQEAAQARRAKVARRARRGIARVSPGELPGRAPASRIETLPQARNTEIEDAARDDRHPVGAGRP